MMPSASAIVSRFVRHIRSPASLPKLILKNILYPFSIKPRKSDMTGDWGSTAGWIEPEKWISAPGGGTQLCLCRHRRASHDF
jgi:hypothetical protein